MNRVIIKDHYKSMLQNKALVFDESKTGKYMYPTFAGIISAIVGNEYDTPKKKLIRIEMAIESLNELEIRERNIPYDTTI